MPIDLALASKYSEATKKDLEVIQSLIRRGPTAEDPPLWKLEALQAFFEARLLSMRAGVANRRLLGSDISKDQKQLMMELIDLEPGNLWSLFLPRFM